MFWIGVLVGAIAGAMLGVFVIAIAQCSKYDPPGPQPNEHTNIQIDKLVKTLEDIKATSELPEGCTIYDTSEFIQDGQIDEIIMLVEDYKYR